MKKEVLGGFHLFEEEISVSVQPSEPSVAQGHIYTSLSSHLPCPAWPRPGSRLSPSPPPPPYADVVTLHKRKHRDWMLVIPKTDSGVAGPCTTRVSLSSLGGGNRQR
jgi:hypothetical protein